MLRITHLAVDHWEDQPFQASKCDKVEEFSILLAHETSFLSKDKMVLALDQS
jgi:hypothetical protein